MRGWKSRRLLGATALVATAALTAAACSDSPSTTGTGGQTVQSTAGAGQPQSLKGLCPDTVVFQTN